MSQASNDKRFKICLLSISLAKGGAERSCAMLSEMLYEKGHEVHLVVLNNEIDFNFEGTLLNLGKLKTNSDNPIRRFSRFKKLRNYFIKNSFDVIIDHRPKNSYYKELFYDTYIFKNVKKIYVIHSSNKEMYFTSEPLKMASIYNNNEVTITVSDFIKNKNCKEFGVENVVTIHNAYNPKWISLDLEIPDEIKGKEYVLSYGRIDDDVKDFSFLIEAYSQSEIWKNNIYLVILGDGKDKEKLKSKAKKLPCKDYIIFLPFTASPFSIIKDAKLVTLTSFFEGFPMVLVESLSMGTPVVSLDIVSGPSEIIKDKENGLLINKREVSLFAEGLQNMINDKSLYLHCKKNAMQSVEQFSMKTISDKWNNILQNELR